MADFFQNFRNSCVTFFQNNTQPIITFLAVLIIGFILVKVLVAITRKSANAKHSRIKGTAGDFLTSLVKVMLYVIYVIALLSLLGVPTTSMIALLSAFALAISLALQGTFSNVAAGFVIVITKPFAEGDYIDVAGVAGSVETITILNTKLITPDNKEVILPNGTVMNGNITNFSAKDTRRVDIVVNAAYGTDSEKVRQVMLGLAAAHPEILTDPAPALKFTECADSSIQFSLRVWVLQKDYWDMYFGLQEEMYAAFAKEGIKIPYKQVDVHVKNEQ